MQTLLDLAGSPALSLDERRPNGWPPGSEPRKKIVVPGARKLILPSDQAGLARIRDRSKEIDEFAEGQIEEARNLLIYKPMLVAPLLPPTTSELLDLGFEPDRFRNEKPRCLALAVMIKHPNGGVIYGAGRLVAIENGLRMGSTLLIASNDMWTKDFARFEEFLFSLHLQASDELLIQPEPGSRPWKTVVALLGGGNDEPRLPNSWRRDFSIAAALRGIKLDVRPSPESARAKIIAEFKAKPPSGLLVWADWVAHPETFLTPFRAARPNAYAEVLGDKDRSMRYEDECGELLMHLREISPVLSATEAMVQAMTWPVAAEHVKNLIGAHFVLTDRALKMLPANPYPDPPRMLEHLEKLAKLAFEYRSANGALGVRLADYARTHYGIEIALFDASVSAEIHFNGRMVDCTPHVKVDDFKSPDQCGRIYFGIDQEALRFVVDHIGLHDYGQR